MQAEPSSPSPAIQDDAGPSSGHVKAPILAIESYRTVPSGFYLQPVTASVEAGRSYIARTGFPLLATSEHLVSVVTKELEYLLILFADAWRTEVVRVKGGRSDTETSNDASSPSPFALFRRLYEQQGWHLSQFHWSEHQETRSSIYHTCVRVLTNMLQPLLPLLSIQSTDKITIVEAAVIRLMSTEILKACGVLFGLSLLQATTAVEAVGEECEMCPLRIPIEADLYHVLLVLPQLIATSGALGEWEEDQNLQPMDDVVFVLRSLMEATTGRSGSNGRGDSSSDAATFSFHGCFDVLAPTSFAARPALINNRLVSQADLDRKKRKWGVLKSPQSTQFDVGQSRADVMRNTLRQRLNLPFSNEQQNVPGDCDEHDSKFVLQSVNGSRRDARENSIMASTPGEDAETELLTRLREVQRKREAYREAKEQSLQGTLTSMSLSLGALDDTLESNDTLQESSVKQFARLADILDHGRRRVSHQLKEMSGTPDAQ